MKKIVFFIFFAITVSACNNFSSDFSPDSTIQKISDKNSNFSFPDIPDLNIDESDVGTTDASFDVDSTGQATYSVPVKIPPGRTGIEPGLSIVYKHRGGNGQLGVGFSLSGLSKITRIGKTWSQDGAKRNVMYNDEDRFAIDGKRLMSVNGDYGADGSEYRTEIDSFVKVISYGKQGNGPQSFKAWTKDGKILEYGVSDDSRIEVKIEETKCNSSIDHTDDDEAGLCWSTVVDNQTVRVWALKRVTDRNSNAMIITYHEDDVSLNYYPTRIDYTARVDESGNIIQNPFNSVQFEYTDRPDFLPKKYRAGSYVQITKLLKHIKTYSDNNLVRKYTLEYNTGYSGRSHIEKIKEENGAGKEYPPLEFTWNEQTKTDFYEDLHFQSEDSNVQMLPAGSLGGEYAIHSYRFVDLNGDGKSEFLYSQYNPNKCPFAGGSCLGRVIDSSCLRHYKKVYRTIENDYWREMPGNYELPWYLTSPYYSDLGGRFVDFNGDGLVDFVQDWDHVDICCTPADMYPIQKFRTAYKNTGSRWKPLNGGDDCDVDWRSPFIIAYGEISCDAGYGRPTGNKAHGVRFIDLNGDGRIDILASSITHSSHVSDQLGAYLNNGEGWKVYAPEYAPPADAPLNNWQDGVFSYDNGVRIIDVDGNGLPDYYFSRWDFGSDRVYNGLYLNNGNGWQRNHNIHANFPPDPFIEYNGGGHTLPFARFVDLNGDGLLDFIYERHLDKLAGNYDKSILYDYNNMNLRKGYAYLNTGRGWKKAPDFRVPLPLSAQGSNHIKTYVYGRPFIADKGNMGGYFIDMNGDALADYIYHFKSEFSDEYTSQSGGIYKAARYNTGRGWKETDMSNLPGPFLSEFIDCDRSSRYSTYITDINGDGFQDIVVISVNLSIGSDLYFYESPHSVKVYINPAVHETIKEFKNGLGKKIQVCYQPSSDELHNQEKGSFPNAKLTKPIQLVCFALIDNGLGLSNRFTYQYSGAKINKQGRGFLGFSYKSVYNHTNKIKTITYYNQYFPYTGTIREIRVGKSNTRYSDMIDEPIKQVLNYYSDMQSYNDTIHFPYLNKQVKTDFKLGTTSLNDSTSIIAVNTVTNTFDDYGNVLSQTNVVTANGKEHRTTIDNSYHNDGNTWLIGLLKSGTVSYTNEFGTQTKEMSLEYNYDTGLVRSALINKNTTSELTMVFDMDSFGNVISTELSGNDIETTSMTAEYDSKGLFPVKLINALGHITLLQYDYRFGLIRSITDPNGRNVFTQYDSFGRPGAYMAKDSTVTTYSYSWESDPDYAVYSLTRDNPIHGINKDYHDVLSRTIRNESESFDGSAIYRDINYDTLGRISSITRPYYNNNQSIDRYEYTYDILNRVLTEKGPDDSVYTMSYNGLVTTTIDPLGNNTMYEHDSFNRIVAVTDALQGKTKYDYDATGNLLASIDAKGNTTTYTYDAIGRRTAMDDPDMGRYEYRYNSLDRLVRQKNGRDDIVQYSYDTLGRLTGIHGPEGESSFYYDNSNNGTGKLWKITTGNGYEKQYEYDELSRLTGMNTIVDDKEYHHDYEYDQYSRVVKETYPSDFIVKYHYNSHGYLYRVTNDDPVENEYWSISTMTADGHISKETFGNDLISQLDYDVTGKLKSIETANGSVQDLLYEFDKTGNLVKRFDVLQQLNEVFEYDPLHRLTMSGVDGQVSKEYQYDIIGNIISKSGIGTYLYNSTRPHAVTKAGTKDLTYDGNGNAVSAGNTTIDYSSFNKPLRIEDNTTILTFAYDPMHSRYKQVKETDGMVETRYYFGPYEKIVRDGYFEHIHYIYGGNKRVAVYKKNCRGEESIHYLHNDHLGSTDVITDEQGAVVERHSFEAFGKPRQGTWIDQPDCNFNSGILPYGFTGHEHLAGGIIHMNGRIYDPEISRFLSADPIVHSLGNPQGLNPYSYVINNPLILIDPSGYQFTFEGDGWWRSQTPLPTVVVRNSNSNGNNEVEGNGNDSPDFNLESYENLFQNVLTDGWNNSNVSNNTYFDPHYNTEINYANDDEPYLGFVNLAEGITITGRFNVKLKSPGALQTGAKIAALTLVTASTASPLPEDTITIPVAVRLMAYATVGVVTARELAYNLHNAIQKAQQAYSERIVKARENVLTSEEDEGEDVEKEGVEDDKVHTPEQQEIIKRAKKAKKTGISEKEANKL